MLKIIGQLVYYCVGKITESTILSSLKNPQILQSCLPPPIWLLRRALHNTANLRIVGNNTKAFNYKKSTVTVFLDIEKLLIGCGMRDLFLN
jgi:hypothetical protein